MPRDFLHLLSDSRMRIVQFVNSRGEVGVEEVATALGMGGTTIRQHFDRLEEMGLLEHERVIQGPGRPSLRYRLTQDGRRLFPSQDAQLLDHALDFMQRAGYEGMMDDFFQTIWQERSERLLARMHEAGIAPPDAPSNAPRQEETDTDGALVRTQLLEIIAEFLHDEGYMPRVAVTQGSDAQAPGGEGGHVEASGVMIELCNCPFSQAVRATRLPCRLEAMLLEKALGQRLQRTAYMPEGDAVCAYEIAAPGSSGSEDG